MFFNHIKISFAILIAVFIFQCPAYAAGNQVIIVCYMDVQSEVRSNYIDSISAMITSNVWHYPGMKVVSEADIQTILQGQKARQRLVLEANSSYIAEAGTALGR